VIQVLQIQKNYLLQHQKRKVKEIVDWLPFEWNRRPMKNYFIDSGDYVQTLKYDPSWPKPDFEFSEELKTASNDIKHTFSLETGSKADIKEVVKRKMLQKVQRHPNDESSLEVKIALMTLTVRSLYDHAQHRPKEIRGGRIALYVLINKRNRLLKTLYRIDEERFNFVTKQLELYYIPEKLGGKKEMYCKKWDLRRLTKEYCENTVKTKKQAYHEELKEQQEKFLEEKKEILAWIEEEEKEIEKLGV